MKERPILFSGEMVRAILDGRKTQTRRIIKPQPEELFRPHLIYGKVSIGKFIWMNQRIAIKELRKEGDKTPRDLISGISGINRTKLAGFCPYGIPGDRLWVKEIFGIAAFESDFLNCWAYIDYKADGISLPLNWKSCKKVKISYIPGIEHNPSHWRSSRFMPRWASRITLEIMGVRVERLQEISDNDCCLEMGCPIEWIGPGPEPYKRDMQGGFRAIWDSINAKRGFGWYINPWVWVIEFKKL